MRSITSYEAIPDGKPLYIYGTGTAGRAIFARISTHRRGAILGFVDSYTRGEIEGLPIFDPVAHRDRLQDAAILIASHAWAEIQHRLIGLGFTNVYNAYPLYTAPIPSSMIADDGFQSVTVRADLIEQITTAPPGTRFAVVGCNRSGTTLIAALRDSIASGSVVRLYDTGNYDANDLTTSASVLFEDYAAGKFNILILAAPAPDLRAVVRRVRIVQGVDAPMWLPKAHTVNAGFPTPAGTPVGGHLLEIRETLTERYARPLIVVVPPCAGTMRFQPQIEHLLNLLGWTPKPFMPLSHNPAFYDRFRTRGGKSLFKDTEEISSCYIKENTESYYWFSKSLRHFEYMILHDHSINLRRFADSHCRIIVLMRDPRDIINSFFYRSYPFDLKGRNPEEFILDLLDGEVRFAAPDHGYRHGSVQEWTDSYLAALESPSMEVVRFEDLHRDEVGTLHDLLIRLELHPNPFVAITKDVLRFAAHLGSFEHQTSGQAKRGEERQWIVGQTSCRKGIVGDWRSTFTPAVVEKFKRLTGDALISLGYEDNMDWSAQSLDPD